MRSVEGASHLYNSLKNAFWALAFFATVIWIVAEMAKKAWVR